jgi:hypothetical protein
MLRSLLRAHFQLERNSFQQSCATILADAIDIFRMEGPREKHLVAQFVRLEARLVQSHSVRIERRPVGRQDHDHLANRIRDDAKIGPLFAELQLGAFQVIDVGVDPTPADEAGLSAVDRRRRDLEPAIPAVKPAEAYFLTARK